MSVYSVRTDESFIKFRNTILLNLSFAASCTVGRNYVITFDSAYYYLNDPDLWQVVFIPDPKSNSKLPNDEYIHLPKDSDVAILSREKDGNIQVRLYFGDKEVQFEKVNDNIRVSVDGRLGREYKKQNKQDITVYQDKQNGEIYMQVYELQDRSIKLHSGKYGIFAVYDGQHILLHVSKIEKKERITGNIRD